MHEREPVKPGMFLGASAALFGKAKDLRRNATEKVLWSRLSNKQLGVKFRRQHPLYNYIARLLLSSRRLVIEVDGPRHNHPEQKEYDKIRTQGFTEFNIKTIRFTNHEVLWDTDSVICKIKEYLT